MESKDMLKNRNSLKKELNSLNIYTENIKDELIKKRIEHLLDWYIRKANFYKNLFYILSMLLIIINAIIPVLSGTQINNKDIVISCISSIATIITSSLTLFTMKDTWFRYRNSVEIMKSECIKFNCNLNEYNGNNEIILAQTIEHIVENERDLWKQIKFTENNN